MNRLANRITAVLVALLSCSTGYAFAEETREQELESVRSEIRTVETNLQDARDESEQIYNELHDVESQTLELRESLEQLDRDLSQSDRKLEELDIEQKQMELTISGEKDKLGKQIRTTYISGRHNTIKLILNQEDPVKMGRLISYNDYFNRARSSRIQTIDSALLRIATVKNQITSETASNRKLREEQRTNLALLDEAKLERQTVLDRLEQFIANQDSHLQSLKKTEAELLTLLEDLDRDTSTIERFEEIPPFSSLKGGLPWPVDGNIDVAFGEYKKGGRIRSMGITFTTGTGTEVRAVASGKVIFADWFRNLGLLLIIDHGDDYMSLYGHNNSLSKKKGDWVESNEIISIAGETGGRNKTSLYFEVRKKGTPLNPAHWCSK